jgi:hypothetical protein
MPTFSSAVFHRTLALLAVLCVLLIAVPTTLAARSQKTTGASVSNFAAKGGLDCNGLSRIQQPVKPHDLCADFRGDEGRGEDNGHYIGHDEPSVGFYSSAPNSGNNVQWDFTLPTERKLPATQTFENQIAFWFSMALCDPGSFPQGACIPNSDANRSDTLDSRSAGSAFLEMQFYPPGMPPFINAVSCDTKHWCASLHINSLECTSGFSFCNPNCFEPTNFAFIQKDGIPTGPAGPADLNEASFTPNSQTLLMNQGDRIRITIKDTPQGLLNRIDDLSTGQSGFMVASAANGFQSLDVQTCVPTPFAFHPEFATAKFGNFVPWAVLQANINFSSEIGHFTPGPNGDGDEDDPPCFPDAIVPGCLNFATGGDLDFDGTSYLQDWPDGTHNNATPVRIGSPLEKGFGPLSFVQNQGYVSPYPSLQFETTVAASEPTCQPSGQGCVAPPSGAAFYPFYTQVGRGANCALAFGDIIQHATVDDFGGTAQYGSPNLPWFFGQLSGGVRANPCTPRR